MRNDILYESVKKFVKTRKEDLNAYFTASLRIRKFIISCCDICGINQSSLDIGRISLKNRTRLMSVNGQ